MRKAVCITSILLVLVIGLSSCTVTQNLDFNENSSKTEVTTDDFFIDVMEDLSSWAGNTDDAVDSFEQNLRNSGKAYKINFVKKSDNSWSGEFSFTDFEQLVNALTNIKNQDIVKFTEEGATTRFEFTVNMDNYETLAKIIPVLSDPNFEVYGPLYNNYLSEEDYLDMIAFILGEDGPDSIKNSSITLEIKTPSDITATNAKKVNQNTVQFTFPLIDFLLLHEGISFWCEYQTLNLKNITSPSWTM